MSTQLVWIRARDGALYADPVFIFPEGFICFDEPELVVWDSPDMDVDRATGLLEQVLGRAAIAGTLGYDKRSLRVVPDTDPWEFKPATGFFFELVARIPRPTKHQGCVRYPRDCFGPVIDFNAHVRDALELEPGS